MFRAKFVQTLAALQCIFLGAKGFTTLVGWEMSWWLTLIPLWLLLGVAVLFWGIVGALWAKFG